MTTAGSPHSDTLGSQPGCRLPEDYRRLQRPSSAPGTKTSTVCPYKLDTRHYMQFCRLQKMLASTMQFSRYGRNHASGPPIREAPQQAARVSAAKAAASSGPNSVLTQRGDPYARSVPPPKRGAY